MTRSALSSPVMSVWMNFIGYQLAWFVVVINAGRGQVWVGIVAALLFISWQLAVSQWRALDLRLMGAAFLLGLLIDGGLSLLGWVQYAAAAVSLPPGGAPIWILALWMSFALTLTRSLAWLRGRPWLAMLLGGVGGPLAYLSASRGWGAVTFTAPAYLAVVGLGVGWAAAMVTMLHLIRRWAPDSASRVKAGAG